MTARAEQASHLPDAAECARDPAEWDSINQRLHVTADMAAVCRRSVVSTFVDAMRRGRPRT